MLRFHLDEHVPHAVVHGLRRRGIDVTTTTEAGLLNADDEDHIAFALREQRVIFTNDQDFLRIAAETMEHAGIVYAVTTANQIGTAVQFLTLMNDCLSPEEMLGRVEFL